MQMFFHLIAETHQVLTIVDLIHYYAFTEDALWVNAEIKQNAFQNVHINSAK